MNEFPRSATGRTIVLKLTMVALVIAIVATILPRTPVRLVLAQVAPGGFTTCHYYELKFDTGYADRMHSYGCAAAVNGEQGYVILSFGYPALKNGL